MDTVELVDHEIDVAQALKGDGDHLPRENSRYLFVREIAGSIDQWISLRLEKMSNEEAAEALRQVADVVIFCMSSSRSGARPNGWQSALNTHLKAKIAEECLARAHFVFVEIGSREFVEPFRLACAGAKSGAPVARSGDRLTAYLDLGRLLSNFTEEVFFHSKLLRTH